MNWGRGLAQWQDICSTCMKLWVWFLVPNRSSKKPMSTVITDNLFGFQKERKESK